MAGEAPRGFWKGCKLKLVTILPHFIDQFLSPPAQKRHAPSLAPQHPSPAGPPCVLTRFIAKTNATQLLCKHLLPPLCSSHWDNFLIFPPCVNGYFSSIFCNCSGLIPIALDYSFKLSAGPNLNHLIFLNSE